MSQKHGNFCDDMKAIKHLESIDKSILRVIRATKSTSTFSAKDFSKLGSSAAVRKALERLHKRNALRRVRRGFYDKPKNHPLLGQTAPDPMDLVKKMMKESSSRWQVSGAYAANLLHLSEQVPSKIVVLKDGGSVKVQLGKLTIEFRQTVPRYLLGAGTQAGLAFQALRYLGPSGITSAIIGQLRQELNTKTKEDLKSMIQSVPAWMQPILQDIVTH